MHCDLEGVDQVEGVTDELVAALRRRVAEEWLIEVGKAEELRARLLRIHSEHKAALRQLASEGQWERYRRRHDRRVRLLRKMRARLGESPEAAREVAEKRRDLIQRTHRLFEREGIDVEAIRRVHTRFDEALAASLEEIQGWNPLQAARKGEPQDGE